VFSIQTSIPSLLAQIPSQANTTVVLPPEAAMRVFRPVLSQHATLKAVDCFCQWVVARDLNVSLEQVAHLWVNYERFFLIEFPKRVFQWVSDRKNSKSPYALGVEMARLMIQRRWAPFALRKSMNYWGRVQLRALKLIGFLALMLASYPLVSWLRSVRGNALIVATLLGLA
jgi:hypothetical protein